MLELCGKINILKYSKVYQLFKETEMESGPEIRKENEGKKMVEMKEQLDDNM